MGNTFRRWRIRAFANTALAYIQMLMSPSPKYICFERLCDLGQPTSIPRLGVLLVKQGAWMSCPFKSLPAPRTQHRKAGLCPQKLPTEGEQSSSQSAGSSAAGWFPFMLIFQSPGTGGRAKHDIIFRQRPKFSFQVTWFFLKFYTSSLAAPSDLTQWVSWFSRV